MIARRVARSSSGGPGGTEEVVGAGVEDIEGVEGRFFLGAITGDDVKDKG